MSKLSYAVVLASLVAPVLASPGAVNAQLTGSFGPASHYAIPGAWWSPYPNGNKSNDNSQEGSLFQQAFAEGEKGNYSAEIQIYTEIVRINPQSAYAYYNIGQVKKNKLNDRSGAINAFRMAANIFQQQGNDSMFRDSMAKVQALSTGNNSQLRQDEFRNNASSTTQNNGLTLEEKACLKRVTKGKNMINFLMTPEATSVLKSCTPGR
jgi:tetratricopeptide (TPR) repeat protein